MKVKSKKNLKKKCDDLFSKIIRSKGYCEYCGRSDLMLNCHHIIGRIIYALRWCIGNGCCLCVKCHFEAHNNPIKFINWFKEHRPEDYEYLLIKKNESKTYTIFDYEEIYQKLKEVKDEGYQVER